MINVSLASDTRNKPNREFTAAEIGALAHLYRGEVYRSTIWRTRLDTTTNWAVVTLGVALSVTYASAEASALPLLLVGILIWLFLILEARRYRYFNVWRARARWMETHFYAPMLVDGILITEKNWEHTLAHDYIKPQYHVSFFIAMGRRIRRNYLWILTIQAIAYLGKIFVHPLPVSTLDEFIQRADIGPIPGEFVLISGIFYIGCCGIIANYAICMDVKRAKLRGTRDAPIG